MGRVIAVPYGGEDEANLGGAWGKRPEPGVRCFLCADLDGLHLEPGRFACDAHCDCSRKDADE